MLKLLLKTRFRYYRNYLKYHLDKITSIELGLVLLVFLFLLARSPADIGYNLRWFFSPDFSQQWARIFSLLLPIFYIISEFFAWLTLRPSTEWHVLGTLPFRKLAVANYYLLRHTSKIFSFIFFGSIAFLGGSDPFHFRLFLLFSGLGLMFSLQLISFAQAQFIRNPHNHHWKRYARWFLIELFMIGFLLIIAENIGRGLVEPLTSYHFLILCAWFLNIQNYYLIQKHFVPYLPESKATQKPASGQVRFYSALSNKLKGPKTAFIFRDFFFLWRQKRSTFYLFIFGEILLILISIFMEEAFAAYITLLSLQLVISLMLIKTVVLLFQNDVDGYELTRTLPIKSSSYWMARWLFIFGFLSLQMILPTFIIPIVFKIKMGFIGFVAAGLFGIPLIMATLYCNSGFGLFPHVHLTGYMISVSILFIILFWFFMPFGSLIILGVILLWIRKSQKRFQFLELL
ncbi:hypothetical protein ISS22_15475 [candidate division KSB1 bacterium]|nr:hypothetical protein [candidate division KSB1 bacterium]